MTDLERPKAQITPGGEQAITTEEVELSVPDQLANAIVNRVNHIFEQASLPGSVLVSDGKTVSINGFIVAERGSSPEYSSSGANAGMGDREYSLFFNQPKGVNGVNLVQSTEAGPAFHMIGASAEERQLFGDPVRLDNLNVRPYVQYLILRCGGTLPARKPENS